MKKSELRIGSLLRYKNEAWDEYQEVQVYSICSGYVRASINNELGEIIIYYSEDLKPIPLTEEWLLKLGFEYWGVNAHAEEEYVLFNAIDGTSDFKITEYKGEYNANIDNEIICWYDFKYVHQLQNLYFALTNNELEL